MNRKIRGIKREIVDKKSKWLPIVIGAAGGYFLLLVWPSFAAGIGAGIAATMAYKAYYGPEREYGTSVPDLEGRS